MAKLKELLKGKLTASELQLVPSSFDMIGDKIVFVHFPDELAKKEKIVGDVIIEHFKHITSVFKKTKQYSGRFRTSKLKLIAGKRSKETLYKENNVRLLFDIEKVYFSPRLSTERKRIYEQVKKGESVLCLFSGCGVYPIVILKNTTAKEAYGVEMNPLAHKYALKNIELNKINKDMITVLNGDVRAVLPTIKKKFDRILMPLPKESEHFLDVALQKIKSGGIVHLYCFGSAADLASMKKRVKEQCSGQKKKCRFLRSIVCGQFSPNIFRWCIDFKVNY